MSIDKVPMPAFVYRSVFKNHLVNVRNDIGPKLLKKEMKISFLGNNEKNILFIFNDNKNKFLGDLQMKFLSGLLTACDLNMGDVAIVNIFNKKLSYRELIDQFQSKQILLFGISACDLDLPFNIPFFQVQNFQESAYVLSPGMEDLQGNKELKKQLWICLQKLFSIKR